jgi:hypothetical protein
VSDRIPEPCSVSCALAMMNQALDYLNIVDVASLPVDAQAGVLTSLEAMKPQFAAARAALLAAFTAGGGPEADGQGAAPVGQLWPRGSVGGSE